jgi:hypothetical protein
MRSFKLSLLLGALLLIVIPQPAYAWFDWIDYLSGPGPFNGLEFDYRVVCLRQQPAPTSEALAGTLLGYSRQIGSLKPPEALKQIFNDISDKLNTLGTDVALQDLAGREEAIDLARQARMLNVQLTDLTRTYTIRSSPASASPTSVSPNPSDPMIQAEKALDKAEQSLREAAVPEVSLFPAWLVWTSCADRPRNEPNQSDEVRIRRGDRHPVAALVLNYRELANTGFVDLDSQTGVGRNSAFATGKTIHLRILEPKFAWPLSGHVDFLDGQAGVGMYFFSSDGLSKSVKGLIVEPVRLDLHFPSALADKFVNTKDDTCWVKFGHSLARGFLSISAYAGLVLFPGGFDADAFGTGANQRISRREVTFEKGFAINIGRFVR